MADARIVVTSEAGAVWVDAVCDEGDDLSLAEVLGILELAKDALIRGDDV